MTSRASARIRRTRKIKRYPTEWPDERHVSTLRLPAVTADYLKILALVRRVPVSVLVADVIHLWVYGVVDSKQTIFKEMMPGGCEPVDVPERFQGYLASIGFAAAVALREEEHRASVRAAAMAEPPTTPVVEYRRPRKPPVTDRPAGDDQSRPRSGGYEIGVPPTMP